MDEFFDLVGTEHVGNEFCRTIIRTFTIKKSTSPMGFRLDKVYQKTICGKRFANDEDSVKCIICNLQIDSKP